MTDKEQWPTQGADFNEWYEDVAKFCALVQSAPLLWLRDSQLKYLDVRVDTRSGTFKLSDRDGNIIRPERVQEAVEDARKHYGETK